ncbi:hypothetical protein I0N36_001723 [Salmonella enterica]|nr:hypothetical protein [Salmonella enterica]
MTDAPIIKPHRTTAQQAQRDEFLRAATLARNWLNNVIWNAERDIWSEVEFYLEGSRYDYEKLKNLLPTDRAEPRSE